MSKPRNALIANIQKQDARRFHTRVRGASRRAGPEQECTFVGVPKMCSNCWELEDDCECGGPRE